LEVLRLLVLHWDRLEELALMPAPFIFAVTGRCARRIEM
jgi:hypothetical protein